MRTVLSALCLVLVVTIGFACRRDEEPQVPKTAGPAEQGPPAAVVAAEEKLRQLTAQQELLQEKLDRLQDRAQQAAELEEELGIVKRELDKSRLATAQAEEALRKAKLAAEAALAGAAAGGSDATAQPPQGDVVAAGAAQAGADAAGGAASAGAGGAVPPLPDEASAGAGGKAPPLPIDSKATEGDAASAAGAADGENVVLAPPVGELSLLEMKTTASIDREGRLAVQEQSTFAAGQSDVYVWLHLANASPDETRVVVGWFKGDKEISNIELKVAGNAKRWRTWAHTRPPKHAAGEWRVEVRDLAGNVLGSRQFTIQ
jgi:hypothetical protein